MGIKLLNKKFKISLFSVAIFIFFLLVAMGSLHVMREKILENSHIMGQEIAARFATRETARIKSQEMLLRSVAQSMGSMLRLKTNWSDEEIEQALSRFTEYMENNSEVGRFDMCAVIDGKLICSRPDRGVHGLNKVKWYHAALARKGDVAYTNLYQVEPKQEYVLTMAVRLGHGDDVLAMNLYPEQLNALLADNRLPRQSYYYLCDPNGNIMFAISERKLSIEQQQPYVDQIFSELRQGNDDYIIDLEGNKRGVYYTVSDKGWISVVTIPYDFLLGDYQNLLQWFILTLAFFALMVVMLGTREHMLNKQVQNINDVVQVMSKSFLAVFRVNLRSGRYTMVKAENMGIEPEAEGSYSELVSQLVPLVEPEAATEFAETFSLDNIKGLVKRQIYDFGGEFRQRFGKEYKWVNVRLVWDELLGSDEAIFFFREVDAEKLKELEHMQLTERALKVARENTKSRNMFFSAMSHDMRAPLNGIIGMVYLALQDNPDAKQKNYLQRIDGAAKNLLGILNDILDFSRMEANKIELEIRTFRLSEVVQSIHDLLQVSAQEKNLTFEVVIAPDVPDVLVGDSLRLSQICINICANAIKFTEEGFVRLTIRVAERNEEGVLLECTVEDSGIGMDAQALEDIFESFSPADGSTTRKFGGTGLGLTISRGLVELMGGTISVASVLERGTTFTFTIRLGYGDATLLPQNAINSLETVAVTDKIPVLLAEDNAINQEIAMALLSDMGANVTLAENGAEAVKLWEDEPERYAAIFMDIQMPVMDGLTACRLIRSSSVHPYGKTIPVIAMTAHAMAGDMEKSLEAGMDAHITKPLDINELRASFDAFVLKRIISN